MAQKLKETSNQPDQAPPKRGQHRREGAKGAGWDGMGILTP